MRFFRTSREMFRRKRERMFSKPLPITFGHGKAGAAALHSVLTGDKADARAARIKNRNRDVRRMLDGQTHC